MEQCNGKSVFKLAPLRKSIYSLHDLRSLIHAANDRYLAFLAGIDNPDAGQRALAKMAAPTRTKGRSRHGLNLFLDPDYRLFLTLARGDWDISGFRAADLRAHLAGLSPGRASYLLKCLGTHGLIKRSPAATSTTSPTSDAGSSSPPSSSASTFVQPTLARDVL
jgi:hypothetical protein